MSRLLRFLLILIVLLVGLAIAVPMLIPAETYRDRVASEASTALGREVTLAGDMQLMILPRVEIRAGDVTIANADGFGSAPMAEMSELRVGIALMPLFSRSVEVEEFVLVDPVIRLSSNAGGNNWTFRSATDTAPQAAAGPGFQRRPGAQTIAASIAPCLRICVVILRVSTPAKPGRPCALSQSPRLCVARQLDGERGCSRKMSPRQAGRVASRSSSLTPTFPI